MLLCGTGTAGAYQAGVLRALTEAGVKIDVLAGHGAGVMTALCGAIDGGAGLWDPAGPWTHARLRQAYRWRPALRTAALGFLIAILVLLSPLVVLILAAAAYAVSVVAALVNFPTISAWFVELYGRALQLLFDPPVSADGGASGRGACAAGRRRRSSWLRPCAPPATNARAGVSAARSGGG